ncbi:MAG: fumarate reductase/succinate dehydrogenase flavoprotein subunit, partial [Thermoplasmata archaeon]
MKETDTVYADFLIVGGGPAGCMAAIRAKELAPELRVIILEKAEISRSGAAGRGMDALNNVVVPGISTVEEYLEALEIVTDGIFDPTISRVIGERSFGILKRLEGWGVEFPKGEDGNYIVNQFHPKGRFLVEMRGELKKILARVTKKAGAVVVNRHPVVDLIKDGDRIGGAVALNLENGTFRAFLAPAVLLCTGGAARIGLPNTGYLHGTFDCPWCNGESWKMGYEAGASLTGFEYTAQSSMTRDFNGAGQSTFIRHGAWLINGLGERFMRRYDPERMERAPAGTRARAIMEEEKAGRGPVAFVFSHLDPKTVDLIESAVFDVERPTMRDYFRNKGIDLRRDPVEVVMTEVYLCGGHGLAGLVADAWGETRVPGLFAAGDSLANPYGFLAGAMCMGEAVAERVAQRKAGPPRNPDTKERLKRLEMLRRRHTRGKLGVPLRDFEYKFRRLVNEYVAPPKSARKLQRFLDETEGMVVEQDDIPAEDPHQLMKVFEAKAGLFCARMAAYACLFRTESRFGLYHERVDYPAKDDKNWKTRVIITAGPEGPVL